MRLFGIGSKRKSADFYDLLQQHARVVHEAYRLLPEYMQRKPKELADRIYACEREADDLRRILIDELNQTLITPFDREDIYAVSMEVDNVVDAAKSTVEEMNLFAVSGNDYLAQMAHVLEEATLEIYESLKNLKQHPNVAKEHAVRAKTAENHMHHIYLEALAKLFDSSESAGYMFKMREIYRHLNRSADRCDEAANSLLNIIVKLE
ncbi:MAG TPA: DUF47 family protein [bacterium]|nr:DUF47 family protein [bacterium]